MHQIVVEPAIAGFVKKRPVNGRDDAGKHHRVVVQEPVAFKDVCRPVCTFNAAAVMIGCETRSQNSANHRSEKIPPRQINEHEQKLPLRRREPNGIRERENVERSYHPSVDDITHALFTSLPLKTRERCV